MPRSRKTLEDDDFLVPAVRRRLDKDLVREYHCFMCGREPPEERPMPLVCPVCGGNWLVNEDYVPRYG